MNGNAIVIHVDVVVLVCYDDKLLVVVVLL